MEDTKVKRKNNYDKLQSEKKKNIQTQKVRKICVQHDSQRLAFPHGFLPANPVGNVMLRHNLTHHLLALRHFVNVSSKNLRATMQIVYNATARNATLYPTASQTMNHCVK